MAQAHRAAPAAAIAAALSLLAASASAQAPQPAAPPPGMAPYAPPVGFELPSWANPRRLEYEEGDPIPPRYELKTRADRGLLIGGVVTFGTPYLVSAVSATFLLMNGDPENEGFGPMLIPVAGPFISIGTAPYVEGPGIFWLAADGFTQALGVILMTAAFGSEDMYLERQDGASSPPTWKDVALHPTVVVGPGATALRWRF